MAARSCDCTATRSVTVAAVVGVLVAVLGLVLFFCMPLIVRNLIASRKELSPGKEAYDMWLSIPVPIYRKFYIFNVTNHEEYLNARAKPMLRQLGPYTYRQYENKEDVEVDDDQDTLKYSTKKTFVYIAEESAGSLDDPIVVPNVPAASVVNNVNETDYLLISILLNSTGAEAFVSTTVGKFLFDGYKDAFVDLIQTFRGETILPDAKFGIMYNKNNTGDGTYKINRGRNDPKLYGKIMEWKNETNLNVWYGHYCNMLNGTDGRIAPSLTAEDTMIYVFSPDICRSLGLQLEGTPSFKGVRVMRYSLDAKTMADDNMDANNVCFTRTPGRSPPSGVLDLSSCRGGAPIFTSAPHFLFGSGSYLQEVDGLRPQVDSHVSFVEVEPVTGMIMRATRRLQLNLRLKNNPEITMYENLTDVFLPFAWIDESAEVGDDIASIVLSAHSSLAVANVLPTVVIGVGVATAFVACLVAFVLLHRFSSALSLQNPHSSGLRRGNMYSLNH